MSTLAGGSLAPVTKGFLQVQFFYFSTGHLHPNHGSHGMEPNNNEHNLPSITERNPNRNVHENRRVSMESSRTSFSSSSCSSSFSSLDCNKSSQLEFSSVDQTILTETPLRDPHPPMNHPNASPQIGRQSLDLRDVVKESIYRESRGLSVKTTTKEAASRAVKHRDSPRPLPLSKSVDGSYGVGINGKPRMPVDLNESLRVLAKLREAPSFFNEARESPRSSYEAKDVSLFQVSRDAPRFSYDGREIPRRSFESRDTSKSTTKLRELPRLSLDSREGSMRGSSKNTKSDSFLKDLKMNSGNSNDRITNSQQEPGLCKRPPSVVAKLMGLEALPNPISVTDSRAGFVKTSSSRHLEPFSVSSKAVDESTQSRVSGSPRSSLKDPMSPRLRCPDSVMKPITSSRCPIEPAPWRQQDGVRGSQKPAFKNWDSPSRPLNSSPSVYSEIEKRLKDLEFKQSDKDLRALKQILEAMQAKGLLETKKVQDQGTNLKSEKDYGPIHTSFNQSPRFTNRRNPQNNHQLSDSVEGNNSSQAFESPIVIMKPAKFIEKSGLPASSVIPIDGLSGLRKPRSGNSGDNRKAPASRQAAKDLPPKQSPRELANKTLCSSDKRSNGRTLTSMQALSRPQQLHKETNGSPVKSSGSVSPKLHQRRLELEKRSARPPIPSSDASKTRRKSLRQPTDSGSPGGKCRPKSPNLQQSDDQSSELSSETRNLSHLGDDISVLSDSNISSGSHMDVEVTSADRSAEINCNFFQQGSLSSPKMVAKNPISSCKQKISSARLSEDGGSMAELATVAPEQPSPVSVLDASFYRDDLPSPVKNTLIVFKDGETPNSDDNPGEDGWNPMGLDQLSDSKGSNFSSDINRKKLENIENLVQKLRKLNSNHNEATTDYIASLCENSNPDHRYISEILLASGLLLRDLSSGLMSIQLHPSGHPINPDLFFVLEQTKASTGILADKCNSEKSIRSRPNQEKLHRKLVFDAVNEILVRKLTSTVPSPEPWIRANKLAGRTLNAQQLLKELCSELDQLQANNSVCSFDEEDDSLKSILWEDVMHQSENWTDFRKDVSGVVLDVERSIFKNLIDEVVNGEAEAASLRTKQSRRCRKLFSK
ncbi:protein LONGIFOLIA 1-like isoform X2 [Macadamia integrifolia]|uniref:protein LONGIFOLIA 1-like isoform X2 n=1 Tax=Macadamia integrifolia TaxID=60698 RepID=UPI001C4F5D2B|nr:protein LONGIFOLIA 1-like isoform X2 [Macadamia integrifolia]